MRKIFCLLYIISIIFLSANVVYGSIAAPTGCRIKLELIDDSIIDGLFYGIIAKSNDCDAYSKNSLLEIGFIYPHDQKARIAEHQKIEVLDYLHLIETEVCSPAPPSFEEVLCDSGIWQINTKYHTLSESPTITRVSSVSCNSDEDCLFADRDIRCLDGICRLEKKGQVTLFFKRIIGWLKNLL